MQPTYEISLADASLYHVTEELLELDRLFEDSGGEVTDDVLAYLAKVEAARDAKALDIVRLYKLYLDKAAAVKREELRARKRRERLANSADGLKTYLQRMLETDRPELSAADAQISWRRSTYVDVQPEMEDRLPPEYLRTTLTANREKLAAALAAGKAITGATLRERHSIQLS